MFLEKRRDLSDKLLHPIALELRRSNPNTFSWLSFVSAFLAGISFYLGNYFLLLAALFVVFNSFFDLLDGKLAELTKRKSLRGSFLDNILDRYSDVFMLVGIMFSPYCSVLTGFFVVTGTLLTSSVGSLGLVSGVGRIRGGFSRADRLLILFLLPIVQFVLISTGIELIGGLWFIEWVMIVLAGVANFSALGRAFVLWKRLD